MRKTRYLILLVILSWVLIGLFGCTADVSVSSTPTSQNEDSSFFYVRQYAQNGEMVGEWCASKAILYVRNDVPFFEVTMTNERVLRVAGGLLQMTNEVCAPE